MKNILYSVAIIISLAACDTPNQAIGTPDPATNTSGTTGSANMTNGNNTPPVIKDQAGAPTDSTGAKKDSLPK